MKRKNQNGFALMLVLIVILAFAALMAVVLRSSENSKAMSENDKQKKFLTIEAVSLFESIKSKLLSSTVGLNAPGLLVTSSQPRPLNEARAALNLPNLDSIYVPKTGESYFVHCLYEVRPGMACTNSKMRAPKVFEIGISKNSADGKTVVSARARVEAAPTNLSNFSYLVTSQPAGTTVGFGNATIEGQVGIFFDDPANSANAVGLFNTGNLEFKKLFTSNIDRSQLKYAYSFPGYEDFESGNVEFQQGIRMGANIPSPATDIAESFTNLAQHPTISSLGELVDSDDLIMVGAMPVAGRIILGDDSDPCRVILQEQRKDEFCPTASSGGGGVPATRDRTFDEARSAIRTCSTTPQWVTFHSGSVPDGAVIKFNGNYPVSVTTNIQQGTGTAKICSRFTAIADGAINLKNPIVRSDSSGNSPSSIDAAHAAFVSLQSDSGVISNSTYMTSRRTFEDQRLHPSGSLSDTTTYKVEASFVALAAGKAALKVDPAIYSAAAPMNFGNLEANSAVISPIMTPTKIVSANGTISGFQNAQYNYPQGFLASPPPGFNANLRNQFDATTVSLTFQFEDIAEALASLGAADSQFDSPGGITPTPIGGGGSSPTGGVRSVDSLTPALDVDEAR